eukprot:12068-Heterococcus_DN1.PRE.1
MENFSAARVNGQLLSTHLDQNIILVAKVLEAGPETSMMQASDGAPVQVKTAQDNTYGSPFVEVVGHVHKDENGRIYIEEFISRDLCENFNLDNYNELVELANGPYAALFKGE